MNLKVNQVHQMRNKIPNVPQVCNICAEAGGVTEIAKHMLVVRFKHNGGKLFV